MNLCSALAQALGGEVGLAVKSEQELVVPLFPQERLRDENAALLRARQLDVPSGDARLLQFMLRVGQRQGRSIDRLTLALAA